MDDFTFSSKKCQKCGAYWIGNSHFWGTGDSGDELDLAGLVCNNLSEDEIPLCINPKRGEDGGKTWEYRRGYVDGLMDELQRSRSKDDD